MKLSEIAAAIGGTVTGDAQMEIHGVASLNEAVAGDLSFLANPKYAALMAQTKASAVLVSADWQGTSETALVRVGNPDRCFMQAALMLAPPPVKAAPGIHPTAIVAPDAVLGEGVSVGPYAVIAAGAHIGARTVIGAHCLIGQESRIGDDGLLYGLVSVRERVRIGHRVIIHHGAVIGSDGFGYVPEQGRWLKIPQIGTVDVGDDVEIGANTTIDRARFGKTVIEDGVKLDNLIQIAHNVKVGAHTAMAAQVGIAGSTVVGRNVQVGGQVGMAGHIKVGDGSIIGAKAGLSKDVAPGAFMFGEIAVPMAKYRRIHMLTMRLPELKERVVALEARLAKLEGGAAPQAE